MADGVEFKLTGVDELLGKLESITDDMKRKGGRAALRKAANIIANRAKANASRLDDPATGRSIADNIAVRWNGREFKRNGNLAFRIGVLHGAVLKKHPDKAKNALHLTGACWNLERKRCELNLSCGRQLNPAQKTQRELSLKNMERLSIER